MYTPAAINTLDTWNNGYLCSVASMPGATLATIGGSNGIIKAYDHIKSKPIR